MDEIERYFSDIENCKHDLITARKAFGNRNTTQEQYDQMEKSLGLMYLYCPESIQPMVQATLHEATIRRLWFEMNIWNNVD